MGSAESHGTAVLWFGQSTIVLATGGMLMAQPRWFKFYRSLKRAAWFPPNWVFGVVWVLLYYLFATSAYLAFHRLGSNSTAVYWGGLVLYELLLLALAIWPFIFFHLQWIRLALVELLLSTALAIGATVLAFFLSAVAGGLLVPLPLWLLVACAMNTYVVMANDVEGTGVAVPMSEMRAGGDGV